MLGPPLAEPGGGIRGGGGVPRGFFSAGFIFRLYNFNPDGSLSWLLFVGLILLNNSLTSALKFSSSESFMAAEIVDLTLALIDDVLLGEERVASWLSSDSFRSCLYCLDVLWPLGGALRGGEGGKA